jgi:hypothetical protein
MPYHKLSWGFAEVFFENTCEVDGVPIEPGWYWAPGQPGCLWDGEPMGPFNTEAEALEDAEGDLNDQR